MQHIVITNHRIDTQTIKFAHFGKTFITICILSRVCIFYKPIKIQKSINLDIFLLPKKNIYIIIIIYC